jgi:hypothetical protein
MRASSPERRSDVERGLAVECELVVFAAQILHEGVSGDDHLRCLVGL